MRQGDVPLPDPPQGDRPSEIWMCGHGKVGTPCSTGPFPNGRCPAAGLCKPVAKTANNGVRELQCARPACLGGPCAAGPDPDGHCGMIPTPCTPVRTAFGRRRIFTRMGIAIGIGVLLIAVGGQWRSEIFAPGPLAQPHALLLGGDLRNDRCAACHPNARQGFTQWFDTGSAGHTGITQADLCMDCHHAKLEPATAKLAHNLPPEQLRLITAKLQRTGTWAADLEVAAAVHSAEIQCAVCHREHHGNKADLTILTNNQCQSCHSRQFASFANGHPQWTEWPYDRGGAISFNHSTHKHSHFSKDGAAFDCRSCHQVNSQGDIARAGSFESMCASCHQQPLEIKAREGFALVALPTLDGDAISDGDLTLGPWPDAALGIDRIEIPELTQALLSSEENVAKAMEILLDPKITSLTEPPGPQSLQAMVVVADALRELLAGLSAAPADEINRRLGTDQAHKALGQFSGQMSSESKATWFDGSAQAARVDPETILPNGGWFRDDLRSAIRYRGTGHSDPLLRELAELSSNPDVNEYQRKLLANIDAVKACLECHPSPASSQPNSWKATRLDAGKRAFTKYSHRPHLNLPELADCTTCHEVSKLNQFDSITTVVSLRSSKSLPSSREATRDFRDLKITTCVGCHVPSAAGDSCTKCHNYHVDYWK